MRNSFCSHALIGLITAAVAGCSSSTSSFLPQTSAPTAHAPAAPAATPVEPLESSARPVSYADASPVSAADVVHWSACGVREDVIVDRVERSTTVFHLTAADENQLRDKGVSETVIREMRATARR